MMGKLAVILFISFTLLLLVYMLLTERCKQSKVPLWLRSAAILIAVAALIGLALPIKYQRTVKSTSAKQVHLLTRGLKEQVADSLIGLPNSYTTDTVLAKENGIPFIADWSSWLASHQQVAVSIHGFGLAPEQFASLNQQEVDYLGGTLPKGVVFAHWNQEINRGSDFLLRGVYRPLGEGETKLFLLSGAVPVDSMLLKEGSERAFALRFQPKQEGKTVLHLAAVELGDTVQYEKVTLMVQAPRRYAVWMLGASPAAEYKFLYNWMSEHGYEVFYRTRISKEKFLYAGTSPALLKRGDQLLQQLQSTDLLLMDAAEWVQLAPAEQRAITRASENGMGILLRGGGEAPGTGLSRLFGWDEPDKGGQEKVSIRFWEEEVYAHDLLVSDLAGLRDNGEVRPLVYANNKLVAATRQHGLGRLTALSLPNTYTWWLQGAEEAYAGFWAKLLSLTLRDKEEDLAYLQSPGLPIHAQWTKLLWKDQTKQGTLRTANARIPLVSNPWIPTDKSAFFWPEERGWNKLFSETDTLAIYAYEELDWVSLRDEERRIANKDYFSTMKRTKLAAHSNHEEVEVPKWTFYVLFLMAIAILWYAWRDYN